MSTRPLLAFGLFVQSMTIVAADDGHDFLATPLHGLRTHNVRQVARLFQYPFRLTAP